MADLRIPRTIEWVGGLDGHIALIEQTLLPTELRIESCRDVESLWQAIRRLTAPVSKSVTSSNARSPLTLIIEDPLGHPPRPATFSTES